VVVSDGFGCNRTGLFATGWFFLHKLKEINRAQATAKQNSVLCHSIRLLHILSLLVLHSFVLTDEERNVLNIQQHFYLNPLFCS